MTSIPPPESATFGVACFGVLRTRSSKMQTVLAALQDLAQGETSVLIEGETGVGKEVAAESVHRASARGDGPFIVFDCAAKSVESAEFELFGAGAVRIAEPSVPGILELGQGGTVLFDHIDELAPPLQSKLLRALERREIRRAGSSSAAPLDVRLMAACTGGLRRAVRLGAFSRGLYAELSRECVRVPPLRERREDLDLLSQEFLAAYKPTRVPSDIPERVWTAFRRYRWPGNVRELQNALQRALIVPDRALAFTRGT